MTSGRLGDGFGKIPDLHNEHNKLLLQVRGLIWAKGRVRVARCVFGCWRIQQKPHSFDIEWWIIFTRKQHICLHVWVKPDINLFSRMIVCMNSFHAFIASEWYWQPVLPGEHLVWPSTYANVCPASNSYSWAVTRIFFTKSCSVPALFCSVPISLHCIVVKVTFSYSYCVFWVQTVYGMKPSSNEDGNGRDPERSAPLIHVDEIFMSKIGRYQTVPTVVVGLWKGESELDIFVAPPRFITVLKMFRSRFSSFFWVFSTLWLVKEASIFVVNVFDSCADVFKEYSEQMLNLWLLGSSSFLRPKVVIIQTSLRNSWGIQLPTFWGPSWWLDLLTKT